MPSIWTCLKFCRLVELTGICIRCCSGYPFLKQALVITCLQYKCFENNLEKGEIACYEQFLLFSECF